MTATLARQLSDLENSTMEIKLLRKIIPYALDNRREMILHLFDVCSPRLVNDVKNVMDTKEKEIIEILTNLGYTTTGLPHRNLLIRW